MSFFSIIDETQQQNIQVSERLEDKAREEAERKARGEPFRSNPKNQSNIPVPSKRD